VLQGVSNAGVAQQAGITVGQVNGLELSASH
jgi:hypothetical protein